MLGIHFLVDMRFDKCEVYVYLLSSFLVLKRKLAEKLNIL